METIRNDVRVAVQATMALRDDGLSADVQTLVAEYTASAPVLLPATMGGMQVVS